MNEEHYEEVTDSLDDMSDEDLDELIATDTKESLDPWDH